MSGWLYYVFVGVWAGGVAAWLFALVPFLRICTELRRARFTGEADHIPPGERGLPTAVIFTKNILPRVERDRQKLVLAMTAFLLLWALGMALGLIFGVHHPRT